MHNNITRICVTDEIRNYYPGNEYWKDDYKELWFIKNDYDDHMKDDIIAAINKFDELIVIDEFEDIIKKFIKIEQRKLKLERINERQGSL